MLRNRFQIRCAAPFECLRVRVFVDVGLPTSSW